MRLLTPEEAALYIEKQKAVEAETKALKRRQIQHKEFTGTLIEKVRSGWMVFWNSCESIPKRFGEPPAILQDGDFKFI